MKVFREILRRHLKEPLKDSLWALYGHRIRNPAPNPAARSFLFVCTGNICRSPFSEGIAGRISQERNLGAIVSGSAGIRVSFSLPPPDDAILAADPFGVDLRAHRSREFDGVLLERYDATVVMEAWQYHLLRKRFPRHLEKIYLLPLFDAGSTETMGHYQAFNIEDPFGKPVEQFLRCYRRIERCVDAMLRETVG